MTLIQHKRKIASLDRRLEQLAAERSKAVTAMIKVCKHPKNSIREYYSGSKWFPSAPRIICMDCGYAEEIWGIGGWKLPSGYIDHMPVPRIDERSYHKALVRFMSQREIVHETIHRKHHGEPKDMSKCNGCKNE